jgi:hypothetical protein
MEIGAQLRWLVEPVDPFEREARWLSRLADEERFHRATAREIARMGGDGQRLESLARQIGRFRESVQVQLPPGVSVPRVPRAAEMMSHDPGVYELYKEASQYIHGSHFGGGLYRRHLGDAKQLNEQIRTAMWAQPLFAGWWGLATAGAAIMEVVEGATWPPPSLIHTVKSALQSVSDVKA